jgi:hypothetical protein
MIGALAFGFVLGVAAHTVARHLLAVATRAADARGVGPLREIDSADLAAAERRRGR